MTHLKRLSLPKSWPLPRKGLKFAVNPDPGPHAKMHCMPLRVILRDVLGYADGAKEAKQILVAGKVLVDKTPRKRGRFPVGLMDVIEIPATKQYFRMSVAHLGLGLEKITEAEASSKFCKIVGKTTLKKGVQQLNLHDGKNILVKKDIYKVGDTVIISLPDQKITKHLKFEKGAHGLITAGRNRGVQGKIKDIETKDHMLEIPTVTLEAKHKEIKTLREYIFVCQATKATKKHPEGHTQRGAGKEAA